jgi:hypothetical protein
MESRENPVFGRKIFFLNPPFNIKQFVIKALQEDEYEVHIIDDYRDAKNILRHFPDSICLINIDEQLTFDQWFNFIVSVEHDESLKSIFMGILSANARKSEKEHFILHALIPAGFIPTNGGTEDLIETLRGILDLNGAKGRRQYVRSKCNHDPTASITFAVGTKQMSFHVLDISTVGLACSIPPQFAAQFQPNSVIRDVSIILGQKKVQCSCAVFTVKQLQNNCSLVLLFMKGTSFSVKSTIREYIARNLQYAMRIAIEGEKIDTTDYNIPLELQRESSEAFLVDAADDDEIISAPGANSSVCDVDATDGLTVTKLF